MSHNQVKTNNNDQGARVQSLEKEVDELNRRLYDQKNASQHPSSIDIITPSD